MQEMDTEIRQGICETTTPKEFRRVALTVAYALSNPCKFFFFFLRGVVFVMVFDLLSVQTDWDVERLADRVKNTRPQSENGTSVEDDRLAKYFENPRFGEFNEPATMLDRHGRIILWYLPLIFSRYRVVMLFTVLFCF